MGSSQSREGESSSNEGDRDAAQLDSATKRNVAVAVAAAAGTALLAWGISKAISTDDKAISTDDKAIPTDGWMKAPGRGDYIPRKDFEDDPKGYFHGLREERRNGK